MVSKAACYQWGLGFKYRQGREFINFRLKRKFNNLNLNTIIGWVYELIGLVKVFFLGFQRGLVHLPHWFDNVLWCTCAQGMKYSSILLDKFFFSKKTIWVELCKKHYFESCLENCCIIYRNSSFNDHLGQNWNSGIWRQNWHCVEGLTFSVTMNCFLLPAINWDQIYEFKKNSLKFFKNLTLFVVALSRENSALNCCLVPFIGIKYFVDLKSNFSLFPRWSQNFSNGDFLKQTPHITN